MTRLRVKLRLGCRVKGQTVSEMGGGVGRGGYRDTYVGGRVEEDRVVFVI